MSRSCPRCGVSLVREMLQRQEIDRCPKCRGMYFDRGELDHLSRLARILNRIVLKEDEIPLEEASEGPLYCPEDGAEMERRQVAGVAVDVCPACEGYWLDGGELSELDLVERHIRENLALYLRLGT